LSVDLPVTISYPAKSESRHAEASPTEKKNGTPAPSRLPDLHLIESLLDKFGGGPQGNGVDAARDIMYDAWDASDKKRRIAMAKKALELSPLCADAHVAALLLGDKKMPRRLPAYIGMGDKNEAVAYVHGAAAAWTATPAALTWVRACQPR
jgi:hypothetical protein